MLAELVAVGKYRAEGILSDDSFEQLRFRVVNAIKDDPGLGDAKARGVLVGAIPTPGKGRSTTAGRFVISSYASKAVASLVQAVRDEYLQNWNKELSRAEYQDDSLVNDEGRVPARDSARRIAAFLLDIGISHEYLSKWLSYRIKFSSSIFDIVKLSQELLELYINGRGNIEILVVATAPVTPYVQYEDGWLTGKEAKEWIKGNKSTAPEKVHAGIVFTAHVWDIYSAVQSVSRAVARLKFRATAKTGQSLQFHNKVWLKGVPKAHDLREASGFSKAIPAYEFVKPSLDVPESENRLEVAIEFLASVADSVGATAAGMSWAALESLFASPGDDQRGVEVAKRAADVALVAYVRSHIYECLGTVQDRLKGEPLAVELQALDRPKSIRRIERLLIDEEYKTVNPITLRTDLAHVAELITPEGLARRREQIRAVILDLYRQRNVTLHGGITDPPLLEATLREARPIVLAVVNRYASRIRKTPNAVDPLLFAFEATRTIEHALLGEAIEGFFA